mmetsp:Transcript_7587/g.22493  ORF Transcript_7587/g.22493 Transcript_7587/m.22493 type:complete len:192 (-) Transcript_7587:46-621(-)
MATEDEEPVLDEAPAEEEAAAAEGEGEGNEGEAEIEEMQRKVQELEAEAAKLKAMQQELEGGEAGEGEGEEPKKEDECSIYVGQVDYEATPEELQGHFAACGTINRVTILCDKFTGRSKGYAYVEFEDKESVPSAILLDNSIFKGRQLKVVAKRVNVRGKGKGKGRGRGRGRGKGRGYYGRKGGYRGYRPY